MQRRRSGKRGCQAILGIVRISGRSPNLGNRRLLSFAKSPNVVCRRFHSSRPRTVSQRYCFSNVTLTSLRVSVDSVTILMLMRSPALTLTESLVSLQEVPVIVQVSAVSVVVLPTVLRTVKDTLLLVPWVFADANRFLSVPALGITIYRFSVVSVHVVAEPPAPNKNSVAGLLARPLHVVCAAQLPLCVASVPVVAGKVSVPEAVEEAATVVVPLVPANFSPAEPMVLFVSVSDVL